MIAPTNSVSSQKKINAEVFEKQPQMNSTDQKTNEAWQECCRAKERSCPDARPNPKRSLSVEEIKELAQEENNKSLESLKEVIKESAKGTKTIGVEEYEELLKKSKYTILHQRWGNS